MQYLLDKSLLEFPAAKFPDIDCLERIIELGGDTQFNLILEKLFQAVNESDRIGLRVHALLDIVRVSLIKEKIKEPPIALQVALFDLFQHPDQYFPKELRIKSNSQGTSFNNPLSGKTDVLVTNYSCNICIRDEREILMQFGYEVLEENRIRFYYLNEEFEFDRPI